LKTVIAVFKKKGVQGGQALKKFVALFGNLRQGLPLNY
jgi:hypothetical protein